MLEKEFHIARLITKQSQGDLHPDDEAELQTWLQASSVNRAWFDEFSNPRGLPEKLNALRSPNESRGWLKIMNKIQTPAAPAKVKSLWTNKYKFAVAAMLLITVSMGVWLYYLKKETNSSYANNILPGKNTATLVLANGRKIRLSDAVNGKLANEAGVSISKTQSGQLIYHITGSAAKYDGTSMNTLSTSKGEQYQVILPDSTKVWLNAASSINYPTSFVGLTQRTVILSGEAYFEVAKDKKHPFIVKTSRQKIQVLGTHFNVNSYKEETATTTTLLEGRVSVSPTSFLRANQSNPGRASILNPGEQAVSNNNVQIAVQKANMESTLDWHRGDFVFNDDDFRATMRKIARWYDVDVVFDPSAPEVLLPGGWVSRSKNLAAVLNIMELTGKVHFKVEGRRVTVTK